MTNTTMASSRASTPASDADADPASPSVLTPRSKVKAMLAVLEDNSDDDIIATARRPQSEVLQTSTVPTDVFFQSPTRDASHESIADEDDSEDEVKPRGRMAARMQAPQTARSEDESNAQLDARERVKRMLMAGEEQSSQATTKANVSESSEDMDASIAIRKRKIRRPRTETPRSSLPAEAAGSSPGGLFVSPATDKSASPPPYASGSEDDLPTYPQSNARFLDLVQKKRQERLAREAEATRQKKEKAQAQKALRQDILVDDDEEGSDGEDGQRLTQQVRPTRKAGKKALEEMHRETQRMARNMQLAHEARTKKKITKASLFARFNYKPQGLEVDIGIASPGSSSPPRLDIAKDTPPTSPISHHSSPQKSAITNITDNEIPHEDEELPTLEEALLQPHGEVATQNLKLPFAPVPARLRSPKSSKISTGTDGDSDSDLEIVSTSGPKTPVANLKKQSVFDRIPAHRNTESHSLHALRMLAHVGSPGKTNTGRHSKPSMSLNELQADLQRRARQQAAREREERLQALRDRGINVQTAEEREKEMADVEDLITKARREGDEIMKREKAAAKKEREANGEVDPLENSSDDEDWEEEKEKFAEQMSGSGSDGEDEDEVDSEDEEDNDDDDADEVDGLDPPSTKSLVFPENEASELGVSDLETGEDNPTQIGLIGVASDDVFGRDGEDDEVLLPASRLRKSRNVAVISDDEDESTSPITQHTDSPKMPTSVLRSATKTFIPGVSVAGAAGLGLTQIFQGTMDDTQVSQDNEDMAMQDTEQDSLAFLRHLPPPSLPLFTPTLADESQDMVTDSQPMVSQIPATQEITSQQDIQLQFSQSQIHGFDSFVAPSPTQFSEYPETQDAGFQQMSPIKGRFAEPPPSTVETVLLDPPSTPFERVSESPVVKRKGRLQRRQAQISDDEGDFEISANAFDVMRKATKHKVASVDDFDRKKSNAKEMVQEQAEESEDEYAGLGGASDDDSGGEEDAFIKEMIDDEGSKDLDESKLAAFYA